MYTYDDSNATIKKLDVVIDRANNESINNVDEFLYNGAIITQKVGNSVFTSLDKLLERLNMTKSPIYIVPDYHVIEEKKQSENLYFVTDKCNYCDIPVSFKLEDVKDKLYIVEDISYQHEGKEPYYLLTNLQDQTLIRYISDFAEKFNKGDIILYTDKF